MTDILDSHIENPDEDVAVITDAPIPSYNSLLKVFAAVLGGAEEERKSSISPAYAQRITGRYSEIKFADLPRFHDAYFDKIEELHQILLFELSAAGETAEVEDAEEDLAMNSDHYKNLLLQWQLAFQLWELEWSPTSEDAAVDLAATGEAFNMFFGQTGLTQFFGEIGFELTEDDQQLMADTILEAREGK